MSKASIQTIDDDETIIVARSGDFKSNSWAKWFETVNRHQRETLERY